MPYYIGILDGEKDVWGVRIPDVPGCHGGGSTPEDAIADAISALREVAAHLASKDIGLKSPRTMKEIIRDEKPTVAESLVMVPLLLDQARSVKANISLDAGLLESIDEEAERHGLTRSSFLASAAREKIENRTVVSGAKKKAAVGGKFHVGKDPITGTWTNRDERGGRFMDVKADPKPFRGARKEKKR